MAFVATCLCLVGILAISVAAAKGIVHQVNIVRIHPTVLQIAKYIDSGDPMKKFLQQSDLNIRKVTQANRCS